MLALALGLVVVASGHAPWLRLRARLRAHGLVTCAIHAVFLALDPVAFWAPASLAVLGAILVTAGAQIVVRRGPMLLGPVETPSPRELARVGVTSTPARDVPEVSWFVTSSE